MLCYVLDVLCVHLDVEYVLFLPPFAYVVARHEVEYVLFLPPCDNVLESDGCEPELISCTTSPVDNAAR